MRAAVSGRLSVHGVIGDLPDVSPDRRALAEGTDVGLLPSCERGRCFKVFGVVIARESTPEHPRKTIPETHSTNEHLAGNCGARRNHCKIAGWDGQGDLCPRSHSELHADG